MALTSLWAGIRTWAREDAATDDNIVLIINENGHDDLLHYTFPDAEKTTDLETGRSNLYEVPDVGSMNIDPTKLHPSSIRVGIRGTGNWRPEDFFVFGEENGTPTPLALARKINKTLSTVRKNSLDGEARLSIPIPPVILGNDMTPIHGLLVLMLTGANGTDSPVELRIRTSSSGFVVVFDMPAPITDPLSAQGKQKHQESNEASFYYVEEETGSQVIPFTKSDLNQSGSSITLRLLEADDWLPASFFVFGIDTREEAAGLVRIVPLVHIPVWDQGPLKSSIPMALPVWMPST
jgi:hypothetical protein